jgi:hypothetical protein
MPFIRRPRKAALVSASAVTCLVLTAFAGATPAFASPLAGSAAGALTKPGSGIPCDPPVGAILRAKAISNTGAWLPTSISSSFLAGPGTISRTLTATSTVDAHISASFEVDESLLFASAKETYGVTLGGSLAHSAQWSYTKNIPAGVTAKVQQYHAGSELGIREVQETRTPKLPCTTRVLTSRTGNFFPARSTADSSYCYAATIHKRNGPQVSRLCKNSL